MPPHPRPTSPYGEAGPPPPSPPPTGRPLTFGRYRGWTLNQVARYDLDYLEWLSRTTMGRNYKRELDELLRRALSGRRGHAERIPLRRPRCPPRRVVALVARGLGDGPLQHHRRHQRRQDDGRQQDRVHLAVR